MNRAFDLIAVVCVAVVVLLPKASVDARPALQADKVDSNDLSRIAELEESLARNPANETVAMELAHFYLRAEHPDWALITLSPFDPATASARTWLLRATAHAERLEPALTVAASKSGQLVCKNHGCPADVGARLQVIAAPMQALLDENIDPRTDPQRAKEAVAKAIHATKPGDGFGAVSSDKK